MLQQIIFKKFECEFRMLYTWGKRSEFLVDGNIFGFIHKLPSDLWDDGGSRLRRTVSCRSDVPAHLTMLPWLLLQTLEPFSNSRRNVRKPLHRPNGYNTHHMPPVTTVLQRISSKQAVGSKSDYNDRDSKVTAHGRSYIFGSVFSVKKHGRNPCGRIRGQSMRSPGKNQTTKCKKTLRSIGFVKFSELRRNTTWQGRLLFSLSFQPTPRQWRTDAFVSPCLVIVNSRQKRRLCIPRVVPR